MSTPRLARSAWIATLALTLAGCPIGNNKYAKPKDLSPSWRIDKLRVLAVRADPPEILPGETATFTALVTDPDGESGAIVWLACPPDDNGGIGFGCSIDPSFDFTNATPDDLAAAGFIGFEPLIPAVYTAPADLLDGLDEFQQRDGEYVLVQIAVLPKALLDEGFDGASFDFNELEAGYKRLVVSTETQPNHNPVVSALLVDGVAIPEGTVVEVDAGESYKLTPVLQEGSVEIYDYTDDDGLTTKRNEEPYFEWYADGGTVTVSASLFPYLDGEWQAPAADDEGPKAGTWWSVVRDRRGGMNWIAREWRVRE